MGETQLELDGHRLIQLYDAYSWIIYPVVHFKTPTLVFHRADHRKDVMKIKVIISYEYDVIPEDYPEDCRTPSQMARLDIDTDCAAMLDGDNYQITATKIR